MNDLIKLNCFFQNKERKIQIGLTVLITYTHQNRHIIEERDRERQK